MSGARRGIGYLVKGKSLKQDGDSTSHLWSHSYIFVKRFVLGFYYSIHITVFAGYCTLNQFQPSMISVRT
jgi:hypothetical protein